MAHSCGFPFFRVRHEHTCATHLVLNVRVWEISDRHPFGRMNDQMEVLSGNVTTVDE